MRMAHVTIRTKNFDEEIRFYKEIAGLEIVTDMRERGVTIVFLANSSGDTEIEVIEENNAVDSGNENISIGFETADTEKLRAELEDKGLEVGPIISPAPVVQFFFVKDPAGVNVQFVSHRG